MSVDVAKVMRAAEMAIRAHGRQERKYTGEPYAVHPASVASMVAEVGCGTDAICAAWLHDVIEDCPQVRADLLELSFGHPVLRLVMEVTKVSHPNDGNRAKRVAMDNEHYACASPEGQTIKLADLIDNTRSILSHGGDFAKIYMLEKRDLLGRLTRGHPELYVRARRQVDEYFMMEERRGHV